MTHDSYQLPLSIGASFTYRAEDFVEHAGVRSIIDHLESIGPKVFSAVSVVGESRSGKTHLSFYVMERLTALGFAPILRIAPDVRGIEIETLRLPPALVIDDAQNLLQSEEHTGAFVSLYEQVRQRAGIVVLLSDRPLSSPNPHLQSRLAALVGFQIEIPAREDLPLLLNAIAKQRGLKLKERDRSFLEKRLSNQIVTIEEYVQRLLQLSSTKTGRIGLETLKDAI